MTALERKIVANGWSEADIDASARALVEFGRREAGRERKIVVVPLTDAEWTQHRKAAPLQYAFADAMVVLSVVKSGANVIDVPFESVVLTTDPEPEEPTQSAFTWQKPKPTDGLG